MKGRWKARFRRFGDRSSAARTVVAKDYEIPLNMGSASPTRKMAAGRFAHAARNIGPVLEIVHTMESLSHGLVRQLLIHERVCDAFIATAGFKATPVPPDLLRIFHGRYCERYLGIDVPAYDFPHAKLSLEFNCHAGPDRHANHPKIEFKPLA